MRKALAALLIAASFSAAVVVFRSTPSRIAAAPRPAASASAPAPSAPMPSLSAAGSGRALRVPSGSPAALSCESARRIVAQARALLAGAPPTVDPTAFGEAVIDWLDPHGLWSAAPDSPVAASIRAAAPALLEELTLSRRDPCPVADEIGAALSAWTTELRGEYLHESAAAGIVTRAEAHRLLAQDAFEDGPTLRPSRELARELGARAGSIQKTFGEPLDGATRAALARALPRALPSETQTSGQAATDELGVAWSGVLLAAAVRAYLPQIDPHGGWAPLDEETSLYEIDLEAAPPPRLWRRMTRTGLGVRIDEPESEGLTTGDVVLSIDGTFTACLSVEQAEQLALFDGDLGEKLVSVLGPEDEAPRLIVVPRTQGGAVLRAAHEALPSFRVAYGKGTVLVVPIGDVPDDLGEELATTLSVARTEGPFVGVALDLRGNGGGSTDGANAALGIFLPGARLFPLRRRDGTIEVERAPTPLPTDRYRGPLAVLVDGETASAAEMIAGALLSYRRGVVIGAETYGKGCAQEYLDDDAHEGVLRLTTLVYALPDGASVQRTGITPTLKMPFLSGKEREKSLIHALAPWHGPDVRDRQQVRDVPWPGHGGSLGPCEEESLCRALRALGAPRGSVARGR